MRWLFWLIVLAVILGGIFLFWGAEDYLSRYLTEQLGTKTTVQSVGLGTSSFTMKGLEIFNPKGSKTMHAFVAHKLQMEAPWSAYFRNTLHLEELRVDSPKIGIELYNTSGSSNNWSHIIKAMPPAPSGKLLKIDRLVLTNLQFDVQLSDGKRVNISSIPYLEFTDLGPGTTTDIAHIVFQSVLAIVAKEAVLSKILNNVMPLTQTLLREAKIEDKVQKQVKKARKKLKKLFKDLQQESET